MKTKKKNEWLFFVVNHFLSSLIFSSRLRVFALDQFQFLFPSEKLNL